MNEGEQALRETLLVFYGVVKKMREAQRKYFQDRTRANLQVAMEWEKETDEQLKALAFQCEEQKRIF